jgi:hypothetical protein
MVERTISVHQDLRALAANLFKLRHKPLEIAGGQREQSRLRGQVDEAFTVPFIRTRFALAPSGL